MVERGIDALRIICPKKIATVRGQGPRYADILDGRARIYFLSADNADSIRGYGFDGVVIDEAPYVPINAWQYVIRPTISQTQGWAAFVGTPKGRNWFYDLFTRGADPLMPDYESFTFPSNGNPHFPEQEFIDIQQELPRAVFRQEYMAEFLEDSAGVFVGIEDCLKPEGACGHTDGTVIGVDLAKHQDYTVCIAGCPVCGDAHEIERYNRVEWPDQKQRIAEMAERHNALIIMDSTGIGDPIFDDLKRAGLKIQGYKLTNESKRVLIQNLMLCVEQTRIRWPESEGWQVVTDEMKRYEYEYSSTGVLRYNAPSGYHDDCVIALGLFAHGVTNIVRPTLSGGGLPTQEERDKARLQKLIKDAESDEERKELQEMASSQAGAA